MAPSVRKKKPVPAPQLVEANGSTITERLSFLIHMISARIANLGNRHFREHDLNHFSARILVLLLEKTELRTGELVDLMVLPQSTISSQLQALQKRGLVRRRRSRQDNRSVMVTLTPAGLELARDCNELSLRANTAMLDGLPDDARIEAFRFLRQVEERLVTLEQQDLYPFHGPEQVRQLVANGDPP
jgi:DNA-binding MarR family transcriptional regulator